MTDEIDKIAEEALNDLLQTDDMAMKEEISKMETTEADDKQEAAKVETDPTEGFTEVQKEAYKQGWRPEGGNKSAEEFIRDGQLIERIKEKGSQIKKLEKKLESSQKYTKMMADSINEIKTNAYQEALAKLEAEREDAIALGNTEEVKKLDKEIEEKKEAATPAFNPEVDEFKSKYSHIFNPSADDIDQFTDALEIQDFIAKTDVALAQHQLPVEKHLEALEKAMFKKYGNSSLLAETEESENKTSPVGEKDEEDVKAVIPSVASGNSISTRSGPKKFSMKDLSHEQKQMCRDIVEEGIMTEEMFIEGLRLAGQIKKS